MKKEKTSENKEKKVLFKAFGGDSSQLLVIACVLIVIVAAVLLFTILPGLGSEKNESTDVPEFENDIQRYEYYVGPEDCADRGEWVDPRTYYGLFQDSKKETDLVAAFFGDGDLKGIVPAGVRIEPVLFSFDDFEPYEGPMNNGFLDIYSVDRFSDANGDLTEPIELQLGVQKNGLRIYNSYSIAKDGGYYTANARLTFLGLNYYINDLFNPKADGETIAVSSSSYGFLEPKLVFDYDGIVRASKYDKDKNRIESIEIELEGSMDEGRWEYTADLCGQLDTNFKTGDIYIRCKLPCKLTKTILASGETTTLDSSANVYFKVSEVRIGTWADCLHK